MTNLLLFIRCAIIYQPLHTLYHTNYYTLCAVRLYTYITVYFTLYNNIPIPLCILHFMMIY